MICCDCEESFESSYSEGSRPARELTCCLVSYSTIICV